VISSGHAVTVPLAIGVVNCSQLTLKAGGSHNALANVNVAGFVIRNKSNNRNISGGRKWQKTGCFADILRFRRNPPVWVDRGAW
jgi:hypothetical protein